MQKKYTIKTKKYLKKSGILNNIDNPPNDYLYEVLSNSLDSIKDSIIVEVGTRNADSAMYIFQAIKDKGKKNWFWTIDPYGLKPYKVGEKVHIMEMDYGEKHYREAMKKLSNFAYKENLNHCHWRLLSEDFMKIIDNIEFWYNKEKKKIEFGFVFLDGEHYPDLVYKEFDFFYNKLVENGIIVIDDIYYLGDFDKVEETLLSKYKGDLHFFVFENNQRVYFTKKI